MNLKELFTRKSKREGPNLYKPTLTCGTIFPMLLRVNKRDSIGCVVKIVIETKERDSEFFHSEQGWEYKNMMDVFVEAAKEGVLKGIEEIGRGFANDNA